MFIFLKKNKLTITEEKALVKWIKFKIHQKNRMNFKNLLREN